MGDIKGSLRFFGRRIQRAFPSSKCSRNTGDHELFLMNNIEYTSQLALVMADCFVFLKGADLLRIVTRHNILMRFRGLNSQNKGFEADSSKSSVLLFIDQN